MTSNAGTTKTSGEWTEERIAMLQGARKKQRMSTLKRSRSMEFATEKKKKTGSSIKKKEEKAKATKPKEKKEKSRLLVIGKRNTGKREAKSKLSEAVEVSLEIAQIEQANKPQIQYTTLPKNVPPEIQEIKGKIFDNNKAKASLEFRRAKIIEEILSTEQSFVKQLQLLVENFRNRIADAEVIDRNKLNVIFLGLEPLFRIHETFLQKLNNKFSSSALPSHQIQIAKLFLDFCPFLKIHINYSLNYDVGTKVITPN